MGISITELTVVFLVALVLFGPDKLPELARNLGKLTGQLRKTSDSLRREFYNSVYPPGQDLRETLRSGAQELRSLKAHVLAPPPGAVSANSKQTQPAPEGIPSDKVDEDTIQLPQAGTP